jgi:hypothetical protein
LQDSYRPQLRTGQFLQDSYRPQLRMRYFPLKTHFSSQNFDDKYNCF